MTKLLTRLVKDEEAGAAAEYSLITAVIALALVAALVAFRDELAGIFGRASTTT